MARNWDYSRHAEAYDKRPDYNEKAINSLVKLTCCSPEHLIADVGAGTGKLTKILLKHSLTVHAVEPNDKMRHRGVNNTKEQNVLWSVGLGESTGLPRNSYHAVLFGSSFNVVDQSQALKEVSRILVPKGWFGCLWNHRDLENDLQKRIEAIIHDFIPDFDYGKRRQDPTPVIEKSRHFGEVQKIEERYGVKMQKDDIIDAWKSHATLYRQANGKFDQIIRSISKELILDTYLVPYITRIWFAQAIQ